MSGGLQSVAHGTLNLPASAGSGSVVVNKYKMPSYLEPIHFVIATNMQKKHKVPFRFVNAVCGFCFPCLAVYDTFRDGLFLRFDLP